MRLGIAAGGTGRCVSARPGRARRTSSPTNLLEQTFANWEVREISSASPVRARIPKDPLGRIEAAGVGDISFIRKVCNLVQRHGDAVCGDDELEVLPYVKIQRCEAVREIVVIINGEGSRMRTQADKSAERPREPGHLSE